MTDPTLLHFLGYAFIQKAYLAGTFIAVLCAMLGLFLVLRKLSLIGDGLSHVSFGAIALGLFLGFYPFAVAVPVLLIASYFILRLTERARIYGDAAIGIVSSIGVATGVILASVSKGFNVDLFSYLFGNILSISDLEVYLSLGLCVLVLLIILLLYHDLFSVTFDEEFASSPGQGGTHQYCPDLSYRHYGGAGGQGGGGHAGLGIAHPACSHGPAARPGVRVRHAHSNARCRRLGPFRDHALLFPGYSCRCNHSHGKCGFFRIGPAV
jgi:hypothetical protein